MRQIVSMLICALMICQSASPGIIVRRRGVAAAGGSPPAFDAVSNSSASASSPIQWNHTITGSNPVLMVGLGADFSLSGAACTFNGVSMTKLYDLTDSLSIYRSAAFILAGPASGTHQISCTASGASVWVGAAQSWTGVNQTTPNRTPTTAIDTAGPAATVTAANSQNNDVVLDLLVVYGASSTVASAQTARVMVHNPSSTSLSIGLSSASATGANTVMSYTGSPNSVWTIGAIPIMP